MNFQSSEIKNNPNANPNAIVIINNVRFTILTSQLVRLEWAEDGEYEFASYREKDLVSTVKATRLSRKIYPKAKESECGEWLEI